MRVRLPKQYVVVGTRGRSCSEVHETIHIGDQVWSRDQLAAPAFLLPGDCRWRRHLVRHTGISLKMLQENDMAKRVRARAGQGHPGQNNAGSYDQISGGSLRRR
jgi:hypothetical protein